MSCETGRKSGAEKAGNSRKSLMANVEVAKSNKRTDSISAFSSETTRDDLSRNTLTRNAVSGVGPSRIRTLHHGFSPFVGANRARNWRGFFFATSSPVEAEMCLGPEDAHPGRAVVNAYDAGRPTEGPREPGTLTHRDGSVRDALLMAPDPYRTGLAEDLDAEYMDWWRDVRAPALAKTEAAPRKIDKALPLIAAMLAVPDPAKYEDSPIGYAAMRRDLTAWMDAALVLVQEATR